MPRLELHGRKIEPQLPPLLRPAVRSSAQAEDPFLPPGYLKPKAAYDVSVAARRGSDGEKHSHEARDDEVLALELSDGSTLITSAARLRDAFLLAHPELIGEDGQILFEQLRDGSAAPRRDLSEMFGGLVVKVFTMVAGEVRDKIIDEAAERLGNLGKSADLGVTWAGTKALMWAIEKRLDPKPGFYRWTGPTDLETVEPKALAGDAAKGPILVFIHGVASSTFGSFGDLRGGDGNIWKQIEAKYTGGIYALEHRTMSESPIENAVMLAESLPDGARVNFVTHSRGGLVADLLCLEDFDGLIDDYEFRLPGTGDPDPKAAERVKEELGRGHEEQRKQLKKLSELLKARPNLVIERYVRVASPARGTLLASGNIDAFLSGLLKLIGWVPFFFGSPWYAAFKRIVIEIAKNRTDPHLVPGIEAMLPDSPMAKFLQDAQARPGIKLGLIAGDTHGSNVLQRLGVFLTDFLLFDEVDNDLIVDTRAMLGGIAPKAGARVLFDRAADVSHFRYFTNLNTRIALRDWLVNDDPDGLKAFQPLPSAADYPKVMEAARRGGEPRPVVVVIPGAMGSHLHGPKKKRIWFDPKAMAVGGLADLAWDRHGIGADEIFEMYYGKLSEHLGASHRVVPFPYDWRRPLDEIADSFAAFLDRLDEPEQPIRLLAHSMGGLVVRACIHKHPDKMKKLMKRDGARFVMLGTPNQGSHSMVESLLGKGAALRSLAQLDRNHDLQQLLDLVAEFRGALQLLPKPGFRDTFQGEKNGGDLHELQKAETWISFKSLIRDFWFGDGRCATPRIDALKEGSWLWDADGNATPRLPPEYEPVTVYVFGRAKNTACGVKLEGNRLRMVGTTLGDGTVTWDSGRIDGIGKYFYMPAQHGDLAATPEYFGALADILAAGTTEQLSTKPPAVRSIEQPESAMYDAGPPAVEDEEAIGRMLLGGSLETRVTPRAKRQLAVGVKAMDLRFLSQPILVGHYENDPLAGPEALIDAELLDGDLSERLRMGLYVGQLGTATAVVRNRNEAEKRRGSRRGAIVTGLGKYDGSLSSTKLREAVRAGVLRYLIHVADVEGKIDQDVSLATLLLGYNSSANLSLTASVEALVRGVIEANARFFETTGLNIRVTNLDLVELYLDTAITAVHELMRLRPALEEVAAQYGTALTATTELERGEGVRQRLFDKSHQGYWPRLLVTRADPDPMLDGTSATPPAADGAAASSKAATQIAERLRFVYVGQRARAESVMLQRQPGSIEVLVKQQLNNAVYQPGFGRALFDFMVPHDFKDAARQVERIVLVVDDYTANLPWELMLAEDRDAVEEVRRPLALRAPIVRQLSSPTFRRHVRQGARRNAVVIGNPSVDGFRKCFPSKGGGDQDPPALEGAELEAESVATLLQGLGYDVRKIIGADRKAADVLTSLQEPGRILHISAHGVFNELHVDGKYRSGVVLSDGLLITSAELEAIESVPDLVFLNCCHLGKVDVTGPDGNKLASSLARTLIDIGVRCVIVSGWAVDDVGAKTFSTSFYENLLSRGLPFGEAVFEARTEVAKSNADDITWGAFQAYGDPMWVAEPERGGGGGDDGAQFVSPDELLDALARTRADLAHKRGKLNQRELAARARAIETMLNKRCPKSWRDLPQIQSALGATWRDLGAFKKAREAFLAAVNAEDQLGVPIRDIEQLANMEARLGGQLGREGGPADDGEESAEGLIRLALARVEQLDSLISAKASAVQNAEGIPPFVSAERSAIRGGASKQLAGLYAIRLLKEKLSPRERKKALEDMKDALEKSIKAYAAAEGVPGDRRFKPYLALNRLAMGALLMTKDADRKSDIALAQECRKAAAERYQTSLEVGDAVMGPEAVLVEHLLTGEIVDEAVFEQIQTEYRDAMSHIVLKPSELDSIVTQIELLSRFCEALSLVDRKSSMCEIANRLQSLVKQLQGDGSERTDRPVTDGHSAPSKARVRKPKGKRR